LNTHFFQQTYVGIYSPNRPEWIIVEHAAYAFSNILVPLYDTLGPDACSFIVNQAEIQLVVCDTMEKVMGLVKQHGRCPALRTIVSMEPISKECVVQAAELGVKVLTFEEVEKIGRELPFRSELLPPKPEDLATICYTSGTTVIFVGNLKTIF
jgi:long-chain acyl-CoA synthetase